MSRQWGTVEERLWGKVDKSGGPGACWLWKGSTASGYGQIQYNGKMTRVHRLAYELEHGEIPEGLDVLHNCPGGDNPLCCNEKHLFLGTHLENMRDMQNKGRAKGIVLDQLGEKNKRAKFTTQEIIDIRKLSDQGVKQKTIAGMYGVTPTCIGSIVNRVNWKHVA